MFAITVAVAAPRMPMSSPKMNMGSRMMLTMAPVIMLLMATFAAPSERTMLFAQMELAMKNVPRSTVER